MSDYEAGTTHGTGFTKQSVSIFNCRSSLWDLLLISADNTLKHEPYLIANKLQQGFTGQLIRTIRNLFQAST
jgi:hypothetical protein